MTLVAVPNVSEGRDRARIDAIANAFTARGAARLLDLHVDPDHHRSVFTLAGEPGALAQALADGARETIRLVDLGGHAGIHPRVGALDVAPVVHLRSEDRGAACAEALVLADLLGELGLPVFLYGALAGGRTRAELRRGGPQALAARIAAGELTADFGPREGLHPTAGATLVAARPPLVAFNVELEAPAGEHEARAIAATIREGGAEGLTGVRAIGLWLEHERVAQVSTNVEDHLATPLATVVAAIARHSEIRRAELVGLAPAAAFAGFPDGVALAGGRRLLEDALAAVRNP